MEPNIDGVWRKIECTKGADGAGTYLVQVDTINPADMIHVDTHDLSSRGYGGSELRFELEDGSIYTVKGPWHGNSDSLRMRTGLDISYLHETKVSIFEYDEEVRTFSKYVRRDDGTMVWTEVTEPRPTPGSVIYEEQYYVLGEFKRGERIAQALADVREQPVYVICDSRSGSMRCWKHPGEN